jgi:membrane protein DedA with SNARE-associated domain
MDFSAFESFISEPAAIYSLMLVFTFLEAIFPIGLLFPGTTFLLFVGYLCSVGKISILPTLAILIIAGTAGGTVSFYLGKFGTKYLAFFRRGRENKDSGRAEIFFEKYGTVGVAIHRFIGPLRSILPFTAGLLKMKQQTFVPVNLFSNLISSLFYVLAGTYFGGSVNYLVDLIAKYERVLFSGWLY